MLHGQNQNRSTFSNRPGLLGAAQSLGRRRLLSPAARACPGPYRSSTPDCTSQYSYVLGKCDGCSAGSLYSQSHAFLYASFQTGVHAILWVFKGPGCGDCALTGPAHIKRDRKRASVYHGWVLKPETRSLTGHRHHPDEPPTMQAEGREGVAVAL